MEITPLDEQIDNEPPRKLARLGELQPNPGHLTPEESPAALSVSTSVDELGSEALRGEGHANDSASSGTWISVRPTISNYPRSLFDGWTPPLPPTPERFAVDKLLQEYDRQTCTAGHVDYIMLSLRDFRIYRPAGIPTNKNKMSRELELEPLQHLKTNVGCDYLLFDGILKTGNLEYFVQGVPFATLAIDGYLDSKVHSVKDSMSIQSHHASSSCKKVWYLLDEPSVDYVQYFKPFQWIADFSKHTIDYMDEHANVRLSNFKSSFYEWLEQQHGQDHTYQQWVLEFGQQDFRQAFIAHCRFLWKESYSVLDNAHEEPIWADINFHPDEAEEREDSRKSKGSGKTVVTPYVFRNFQHITQLSSFFEVQKPKDRKTTRNWWRRKTLLGFTDAQTAQSQAMGHSSFKKGKVRKGDFVVIRPDETIWKDSSESWYGYVQDIHKDQHGQRYDVLWLYPASATTLAGAVYPFSNELFFSQHCNCNEAALRVHDIIGKVDVKWLRAGSSMDWPSQYHFFIRQLYDTEEHGFMTLRESHFLCLCKRQPTILEEQVGKFPLGDTYLVPFATDGRPSQRPMDDWDFSDDITDILEPVVVTKYLPGKVSVRRLLRRGRDFDDCSARPNELVWTNEFLEVRPNLVGPRCHVRFFQEEQVAQIPPPYNRNGTGNCFYITTYLNEKSELERLSLPFPTSLNEGLDPLAPPPRQKMIGLDSFAGGGNFGRGLSEGMAVEFQYAIDWEKNAVQTYRANHNDQHHCWVYWGSVNDFLTQVMNGNDLEHYARVGNIDFIAAGSPCQGFSHLQQEKASSSSLRNISMVASVAAYVDLYRPKYALLENVVAMAQKTKGQLGIFPQLLCTLVGMGYQLSQYCLDAWSLGDPQKRSRLFISIAAPGLMPIAPPTMTHSHPDGTKSLSLGKVLANDLKFGERRFAPTPFQYVSVQQAMGDLPNIGDSHMQTCIPVPDHRNVSTEAAWVRRLLAHIPIDPPCQTAMTAIRSGAIPGGIAEMFLRTGSELRKGTHSRSWGRVPAHGLTSTITTAPAAACGINGRVVHWQQHRVLTIREARRAQGFDENDVITGTPGQQWKIIGNSVSRAVALGLGMALQEAWLSNPPDEYLPFDSTPTLPLSPAASNQSTKPRVVVDLTKDSDDEDENDGSVMSAGASTAGEPQRRARSPVVMLKQAQKRKWALT